MIEAIPLTIKQANALVTAWHRHHKPVRGHRFSIGARVNGELVGAAIVGRPVARRIDQYNVCEVVRLVTNGAAHVPSFLYASCARAAKAMGFTYIQTYILDTEPGTTLKAAGWTDDGVTRGGDWNRASRDRRVDQPMTAKRRFIKTLKAAA